MAADRQPDLVYAKARAGAKLAFALAKRVPRDLNAFALIVRWTNWQADSAIPGLRFFALSHHCQSLASPLF